MFTGSLITRRACAATLALVVLPLGACVAADTSGEVPVGMPPASYSPSEPEVCSEPAIRPVCTNLDVIAVNDVAPSYETVRDRGLSLDRSGRLRYDLTLQSEGDLPGSVKNHYLFLLEQTGAWRRRPAPAPYDLRFLGEAPKGDAPAEYELLIDIRGPKRGPGLVRMEAVVLTVLPARALART